MASSSKGLCAVPAAKATFADADRASHEHQAGNDGEPNTDNSHVSMVVEDRQKQRRRCNVVLHCQLQSLKKRHQTLHSEHETPTEVSWNLEVGGW